MGQLGSLSVMAAEPVPLSDDAMFTVFLIVGTMAFAISGSVAAMRAGMDLVGVMVLAFLVAVGGGSLRDLSLGLLPMWWIEDEWAGLLAVATGLALVPLRHRFGSTPDSWRAVVVADAIGLAVFAVTGASVALTAGFDPWVAAVMGALTGVGGGLLRDVLVNMKPMVLVGQVYASAAFAGSVTYVVLVELGITSVLAHWIPVVVSLGIRLVAIKRRWAFPPLYLQEGSRTPESPAVGKGDGENPEPVS